MQFICQRGGSPSASSVVRQNAAAGRVCFVLREGIDGVFHFGFRFWENPEHDLPGQRLWRSLMMIVALGREVSDWKPSSRGRDRRCERARVLDRIARFFAWPS